MGCKPIIKNSSQVENENQEDSRWKERVEVEIHS